MKNKYLNKIIEGETLKVLRLLPNEIVDMGITSPPYNKKEKNKGWLVKNVKYSDISDKVPEKEYQKRQIEVLNELYRITKPWGSFMYNHKLRWERGKMIHPMDWLRETNWHIRQEIIWDRMIAANIRGWRFWQVEERIYWLYKPNGKNLIGDELESKHALLTSVWRIPPERDNPHPAPFPLILPVRAIYSIMDDRKGLIIDPYSGSGTALVAAKILGHDFIGIDISKEYNDFARKRLKSGLVLEELKAREEIQKHIVNKTFKERKKNGEFVGNHRKGSNKQKSMKL